MSDSVSTADRFKRRLRRISESSILKLREQQFFQPPELLNTSHIIGEYTPILDINTPIGSMGSCFAREIKSYLESNSFNYIHYGEGRRASHGSAAWERVYNTACILQEVQRALLGISRLASYVEGTDGRVYDLCRKGTSFSSWDEARSEEKYYIQCAGRALRESEVFIFTLGMSEVWHDRENGITLAEAPPAPAYDPKRHSFGLLSAEENIDNFNQVLEVLFSQKPKLKIILTVSPVPLRATFFNRSAMVSNNVSKATLLYAAHSINYNYDNLWYFPSYEITQYLAKDPFGWDGRHVTEGTIQLIMDLFRKTFERSS